MEYTTSANSINFFGIKNALKSVQTVHANLQLYTAFIRIVICLEKILFLK